MNLLVQAVTSLARMEQSRTDTDRRRQDIEREKRFNVGRVIPKIQAETGTQLLDEIDEFETEFVKANPGTLK